MPRARVRSLELQAICHATESPEKVRQALLNLLPPGLRSKVGIEENQAKGHHGNPITLMRTVLSGRDAEEAFTWLLGRLSRDDMRLLELSMEQRVDKGGHLYLRLDKQEAYRGRVAMGSGGDVIRLVASIRGRNVEEVIRDIAGHREGSGGSVP